MTKKVVSEDTFKKEFLCEPFTDHNWREKPCGCRQLFVDGFWENRLRCEKHQKMVNKIESSRNNL